MIGITLEIMGLINYGLLDVIKKYEQHQSANAFPTLIGFKMKKRCEKRKGEDVWME